jgi:hypothetical protein
LSQEKVSFQEGQQQFTTRILSLEVQIEEAWTLQTDGQMDRWMDIRLEHENTWGRLWGET